MNLVNHNSTIIDVVTPMIRDGLAQEIKQVDFISGGGNNRSYLIVTDTRKYFLKEYFNGAQGMRDRLKAEYNFSSYIWSNGIKCIPQPLAVNTEASVALYEYIEGEKLKPSEINEAEVAKSLEFILAINSQRNTAQAAQLIPAAEACFSIKDHIQLVHQRIKKLDDIEVSDEIAQDAVNFINHELIPKWALLKEYISSHNLNLVNTELGDDKILSPSDFGFHNALRDDQNELKFFDFEYAGWDDPAKLACDFFSQPDIPISMVHFQSFCQGIATLTKNPEQIMSRIHLLLPLIRIKWCCITLNCFVTEYKERKKFAFYVTDEYRLKQIAKARLILDSTRTLLEQGIHHGIS